jgi:hypothetical protein
MTLALEEAVLVVEVLAVEVLAVVEVVVGRAANIQI